ncbi:hypothetical protein BDV06DRAFT_220629 [Aspergillus oleicola]
MSRIKRILLRGWAFCVEQGTYMIFREGVKPENRVAFANNVVDFVNNHGLDGVDFDWEYPAAPDLPNIPPGNVDEGKNYSEFLKLVKSRLANKSVSVAAPSSYWYLKGFPIKDISKVVDYIIYMTYDLHGQWDYGNKWSSNGCPEGNCLRSHINITETHTALTMITKAGVSTGKVFCGIASYGRSFKMAEAGCIGPMCHYTGSNNVSDAAQGGTGVSGVPRDGENGEDEDEDNTSYEPFKAETPYKTLEDLRPALDSIPGHCRNVYISGVLKKMLDAAIAKYKDTNNGYDGKFRSYAKYMKKTAPGQLDTFMNWLKGPGKCPVPYHGWIMYNNRRDLEYTLTDDEGFYRALLDQTGLDKDAIEFGSKKDENACFPEPGVICDKFVLEITNSPLVKKDFEPSNPKDIVVTALEDMTELRSELNITSAQIGLGRWEGDTDDIVQVLSMPIFMIIQAVKAMEEAKESGEDIEEQEQRSLVLDILSAVLFFVPLVGEAVAVVTNMGRLARMIAMAGAGGTAGMALIDIINDPEMAPLAILRMLSGGRLRSAKDYRDAAKARRSMSAENLGKLGEVFKKNDDVLQYILMTCAK